uniref:Uncharacterized protein n=1 Tax=Rhizophora mucronata TaxID=61149 RepID=A0A2P2P3S2_RHIMU
MMPIFLFHKQKVCFNYIKLFQAFPLVNVDAAI